MGLNTNINFNQASLPRYQEATSSLQNAISGYRQNAQNQQKTQLAALGELGKIAEKQTIAGALTDTKSNLQANTESGINQAFESLQLDKKYETGLKALDDEYKVLKHSSLAGWDANGNETESPELIAYKNKAKAFEDQYKGYRTQLDSRLNSMNQTAKATQDAGFDPVALEKQMTDTLVQKGLPLEQAMKQSKLAASQYMAAPMTDTQKELMKSQLSMAEKTASNRQGDLRELLKDTRKSLVTGNTINVGGTSGTGYSPKNAAAAAKYNNIESSKDRLMSEFDNLGWGVWKDNKDVVNILDSAYKKYGSELAPGEITDIILSNKDDGFIKDTLKGGTGQNTINSQIEYFIDSKKAAMGTKGTADRDIVGNKRISNKEYQTLSNAIKSEYDMSVSRIQQAFQSGGNQATGVTSLNAQSKLINALTTGTSKPTKVEKPGSVENKSLFTKTPLIGSAMKSKSGDGALAKIFVTTPDDFAKEFQLLDKTEQTRVSKVLANSTKQIAALRKALSIKNGSTKPEVAEPTVETTEPTVDYTNRPLDLLRDKVGEVPSAGNIWDSYKANIAKPLEKKLNNWFGNDTIQITDENGKKVDKYIGNLPKKEQDRLRALAN